ncbi:MAG: cupin domain-containing protein [Actinomycetota bacterium]
MSGWFVVNVADAPALHHDDAGDVVAFEAAADGRFPDFGINVRVLRPGQPDAMYHAENRQEGFLVLSGECVAIVDGEERPLKAWDYLHCPAGTPHVLVGAGDGPCAIVMVGGRGEGATVHYPVSEAAARFGASVAEPTDDPREAYAPWGGRASLVPTRITWPPTG